MAYLVFKNNKIAKNVGTHQWNEFFKALMQRENYNGKKIQLLLLHSYR
jgi:hypothetical protein